MLPNAITNTGPYAGFWSHLKSIDHVLERILNPDVSAEKLSELDRDRLKALVDFLKDGLLSESTTPDIHQDLLNHAISTKPEYSSALNLRAKVNEIEAFNNWKKKAKKGPDEIIQRLIQSTQDYLTSPPLILTESQKEELWVIHAIIHTLVFETEAAMQH